MDWSCDGDAVVTIDSCNGEPIATRRNLEKVDEDSLARALKKKDDKLKQFTSDQQCSETCAIQDKWICFFAGETDVSDLYNVTYTVTVADTAETFSTNLYVGEDSGCKKAKTKCKS